MHPNSYTYTFKRVRKICKEIQCKTCPSSTLITLNNFCMQIKWDRQWHINSSPWGPVCSAFCSFSHMHLLHACDMLATEKEQEFLPRHREGYKSLWPAPVTTAGGMQHAGVTLELDNATLFKGLCYQPVSERLYQPSVLLFSLPFSFTLHFLILFTL
jgi:hypothetical protein